MWSGDAPDDGWEMPGDLPASFDDLPVPSSWVLHGHSIPIYTNVIYPFDPSDYPAIPLADEGGDHRRTVEVPADWDGERVILRIGAAESAVEVHVNGQPIGTATDSRLPSEFDVTDAVVPGEAALVALRVYRWSASTWIEDQDMWWMAGLHRSIHLYPQPVVSIADWGFETTSLAADRAEVEVTVEVSASSVGGQIEMALSSDNGALVAEGTADVGASETNSLIVLTASVEDPALWSAEQPVLHRLDLALRNVDGSVLDRTSGLVGIRSVTVDAGRLCVNGVPVTIYGVNRHEHDPDRSGPDRRAARDRHGAARRPATSTRFAPLTIRTTNASTICATVRLLRDGRGEHRGARSGAPRAARRLGRPDPGQRRGASLMPSLLVVNGWCVEIETTRA